MPELQLKKAASSDWRVIAAIEKQVDHKLFFSFDHEAEIIDYIKKSVVYFIINNYETIGTISYTVNPAGAVYLDSLVVLPQYRRLGIATAAMNSIMREIGAKKCLLAVHPENSAAIKLYFNLGFIITAWKDSYFKDGEPRLIMEKTG